MYVMHMIVAGTFVPTCQMAFGAHPVAHLFTPYINIYRFFELWAY